MLDNYLKFLSEKKLHEIEPALLAITGTSLALTAFRMYKEYMTKASRACDTMTGRDKSLCMTKYKISALFAQRKKLKEGIRKCSQARHPDKCEGMLRKKLEKVDEKIQKSKERFKMIYKLASQSK